MDLLCQAILSNHFHLVLRSRPDVVAEWDDTEVARRWLMLCPLRRDENRQPLEPSEAELNSIRKNKDKLQQVRSRLSDISWWMRLLSQKIAQRANRDDQEVGKFWQVRYRAVRLLDETALVACAAYVDLNPIRAAMAETVEGSDYTSAQKRCHDMQASRPGTARKTGRTPQHVPPLLDRLALSSEMWQRLVRDFGRLFSVVAGQPHCIDEHQAKRTCCEHRYRTRRETRELFSTA